jgi:hypothetical protein
MKINFTVEQARKVLATVSPGTHYWHEANRVLMEAMRPEAQIKHHGPTFKDE